jgi:pimeloyl-ACP methyl ester carboxylesterase
VTGLGAARLLAGRPLIMPGVGHMLMLEDPERFNEILRAVLAGFD